MPSIAVRDAVPADLPVVRALIEEYCQWMALDAATVEIAAEIDRLPARYVPPDGRLLVGLADGQIQGMVACRRFDEESCEMKRLYVRPAARGLGLARALVNAVLVHADARGYRRTYLDTLPIMPAAQRLYESLGFREVAPYYETTLPGTRFMARDAPAAGTLGAD